jgi:hypothetical protein
MTTADQIRLSGHHAAFDAPAGESLLDLPATAAGS